jgi:hypothetical protein
MENSTREILIVTGANGISGGKAGNEKLWTISCTVLAWKEIGGKITVEERRLVTKGEEEKLRRLQEQIKANGIYQVRATSDFELYDFIGEAEDSELESFLAEQLKPVYFEDSKLGKFELDRSVDWFERNIDWMGEEISLTFDAHEESEMRKMLETGHILFDNQVEWDKKIRSFACDDLLELLNDSWLEDDEEKLMPETFQSRMVLDSIALSEDGCFNFWFGDDDMFL